MLTGASSSNGSRAPKTALASLKGIGNPHHYPRRWPGCAAAELAGASLERRLRVLVRRPRRGPHAQLLPRDRRPQREAQGLRDRRAPRCPSADGLPARTRRCASGRLRTRPRAPHRRRPDEAVPLAPDPHRQDPGVPAAHQARRPPPAVSVLAGRLQGTGRSVQRPSPGDRRGAHRRGRSPAGFPAHDLPSEPSVFAPDYAPEEIAAIAEKLRVQAGLPKQPTGEVANGNAPSKPRATRSKSPAKKPSVRKTAARRT